MTMNAHRRVTICFTVQTNSLMPDGLISFYVGMHDLNALILNIENRKDIAKCQFLDNIYNMRNTFE